MAGLRGSWPGCGAFVTLRSRLGSSGGPSRCLELCMCSDFRAAGRVGEGRRTMGLECMRRVAPTGLIFHPLHHTHTLLQTHAHTEIPGAPRGRHRRDGAPAAGGLPAARDARAGAAGGGAGAVGHGQRLQGRGARGAGGGGRRLGGGGSVAAAAGGAGDGADGCVGIFTSSKTIHQGHHNQNKSHPQ